MKTPLTGLGIWIWELRACEGENIDKIIERAIRCGVTWIAVKSGDSRPNGQITPSLVARFEKEPIDLVPWFYSVPGENETIEQLAHVNYLTKACGLSRFIIDAELEWETRKIGDKVVSADRREEAAAFHNALIETAGPDVWIADAPWAIPSAHPLFPWAEFSFDARMPQVYWTLGEQDFAHFAARSDGAWAKMHEPAPLCPVGSAFDSGTFLAKAGDVAAFLARYQTAPACSLWSWQHIPNDVWAMLEKRANVGGA